MKVIILNKICKILLNEYSNKLNDIVILNKTHNDDLAYVTKINQEFFNIYINKKKFNRLTFYEKLDVLIHECHHILCDESYLELYNNRTTLRISELNENGAAFASYLAINLIKNFNKIENI